MPRMAYLLIACLYLGGCGMTAPHRDAGFADVETPNWRHTDQTMNLSIGPTLLSIAAVMIEDDPKAQEIMRSLDGVRVKVYEVEPGHESDVKEALDHMRQSLLSQAWEPVILVEEQGESTYLLVKMDGDQIHGITVLNTDGVEAVFVNVMGNLQPEMFNQTVAALELPTPAIEVASEQAD